MGNSQAKKEKRRLVLDVPDRLPVPIVDNHTHISPDPVVEGGAVQDVDDSGNLRMPVLLDTLRSGMAEAGVRAAITSGCEVPMLDFTHRLAQEVPEVWAALAIHPNDAALHAGVREVAPDGLDPHVEPWHEDFSVDDAVARVAELSSDPCVVAVGKLVWIISELVKLVSRHKRMRSVPILRWQKSWGSLCRFTIVMLMRM